MKRSCTKCRESFELSSAQLNLLDKLAPTFNGQTFALPFPTLCPDCRKQRRLSFRNDLCLYQRTSSLSGKRVMSIYPEQAPFPVYEHSEWWSDGWDPLAYGREFDFGRPFFEQFVELRNEVPRVNLYVDNLCENCRYSNQITMSKSCYLLFSGSTNEECHYSYRCNNSRNCLDCLFIIDSELCYQCIDVFSSYNCRYCRLITNCSDSAFLFDCQGCQACLFCCGLRNKQYHIFNRPYSKTDYERELKRLSFGSYLEVERMKLQFDEFIKPLPRRHAYLKQVERVSGDNIQNAKHCAHVFDGSNLEDVHYGQFIQDTRDSMDVNYCCDQTELCYETCTTGISAYRVMFSIDAWPICSDVLYCDSCSNNTRNCLGCVGLRGKEYCILNKQYTEREYNDLAARIIRHMQQTGEWGEFFPAAASPFGYNETVAHQYYPLSPSEAALSGFSWRHEEGRAIQPQRVRLVDDIQGADESVTQEALTCDGCARNYRLTGEELKFYRSMSIPLPRKCFFCRHAERMSKRNPRALWERPCSRCGETMLTNFRPDSTVPVLCESCYLGEVYG